MMMSYELTAMLRVALILGAALTSNCGDGIVDATSCRVKGLEDVSTLAIPLLEVENACHLRLRYWTGREAKLFWLQVISIAFSTPSEAINQHPAPSTQHYAPSTQHPAPSTQH